MASALPDPVALAAAPIWKTGRRPKWWSDIEVRAAALSIYRQMSLDEGVAILRDRLGTERAPSRSSLHRFWQTLDLLQRKGRR